MNNHQKDNNKNMTLKTQKTPTSQTTGVANYYNVPDQDSYVFMAEKSKKIVTALYMITDFLPDTDPLRESIRDEIVSAMQDLFMLTHAHNMVRVELLSSVKNSLYTVSSFLEVIYQNGYVSEMNLNIIKAEIQKLDAKIDVQLKKSMPYDQKKDSNQSVHEFSFSEEFFAESTEPEIKKPTQKITPTVSSDTSVRHDKTEAPMTVSQMSLKDTIVKHAEKQSTPKPAQKDVAKPTVAAKKTQGSSTDRQKRHDVILTILKQKKKAKIGDISLLIKDCSAKTIQRDLNALIGQGLIFKEGEKRWSTYSLNY